LIGIQIRAAEPERRNAIFSGAGAALKI